MAITASDIHNQSFSIDRKGYDVDEVDVFLEHVDEIDILNDTIAHLQDQLEADRFSGFDAPAASTVAITEVAAATVDTSEYDAQLAQKDAIIADLERQLSDKRADDTAIAQALIIARFSPRPTRTPPRPFRTPVTRPSASSIAPTPTVRTSSMPSASCRTTARTPARSTPTC